MTGFGDKLRREREMRGISLEEISESTKIGTRSLRALEEDDFEKLPGGIFNKGFVRAYSRFLGLDEDQTVADFDAALKEYNLARGQVDDVPVEQEPEPVNTKAVWLIAAALVLIAAFTAAGYFLKRPATVKATQSQPETRHNSASVPEPVPVPSASARSSPANVASITPGTPQPRDAKSIQSGGQKLTSSASGESDSAVESANNKTGSGAQSHSDSSSPIRLEVFAREESWLSVSADGRDLGQQLLAAQKSRTIRAQKEVRLKLGNTGGVEISFNGKPVNIDGEPKQVKEFVFTPDGLHQ